IDSVLVGVQLAAEVIGLPQGVAPALQDLSGSEFERILLRQWNALETLRRILHSAEQAARGLGLQVDALEQAADVALAERNAARASFDAEIALLNAGDPEIAALLAQLDAQKAELDAIV